VTPGTMLGPYHVLAPLAQGGMATVFLAASRNERGWDRFVAIKVIRPELVREDPEYVRMFIDEARLISRIRHPNVIRIESLGEQQGVHFLVMELVLGLSLSQILKTLATRGCRLTETAAIAVVARATQGLHAAHEATDEQGRSLELVHRDVSPQNILIGTRGEVKVIDFGVAKATGRLARTRQGETKGKLRYMSPEQVLKHPTDRRTDVWALGVVLWELVAMRRMFHGASDVQVVQQLAGGDMPVLGRFRNIPHDLERAISRCLRRSPTERPQSMPELAQELRRAVPRSGLIDDNDLAGLLWVSGSDWLHEVLESAQLRPEALGLSPPPNPYSGYARTTEVLAEDEDIETVVARLGEDEHEPLSGRAIRAQEIRGGELKSFRVPGTEQWPAYSDDTLRRIAAERAAQRDAQQDESTERSLAPGGAQAFAQTAYPAPHAHPPQAAQSPPAQYAPHPSAPQPSGQPAQHGQPAPQGQPAPPHGQPAAGGAGREGPEHPRARPPKPEHGQMGVGGVLPSFGDETLRRLADERAPRAAPAVPQAADRAAPSSRPSEPVRLPQNRTWLVVAWVLGALLLLAVAAAGGALLYRAL